jgi:hypothetical protein
MTIKSAFPSYYLNKVTSLFKNMRVSKASSFVRTSVFKILKECTSSKTLLNLTSVKSRRFTYLLDLCQDGLISERNQHTDVQYHMVHAD